LEGQEKLIKAIAAVALLVEIEVWECDLKSLYVSPVDMSPLQGSVLPEYVCG
jgi:hypothetical protein